MSQITNIVETVYRARGAQAISESRAIAQGIGGISRSINEATSMSSKFERQWQAIGTTIRYSIAGGAVFGLTNLVSQLKDVQVQLGLISAIGETAGGGTLTGGALSNLFAQNRMGAVDAITPVKEYNDAVINLLSTIQGVPEDQITPMVTTISKAAKLAQISSEDATKAFTTMNVAFGRPTNLQNVHKMAQEFFILTREAPGGIAAGQQVVGQLGQLAQVTRLAHGTPEDMFALLLSTLRSGIPPSQAGRGLQYLIQTVGLPGQQAPPATRALAQVGITTSNGNLTLQQRLGRIFTHARQLGVHGTQNALTKMDDQTLSGMGLSGDSELTPSAMGQFGISGQGAAYLGTVFRRIHALRTALAIMGQADVGQAQEDLQTINNAASGHVSDINDLDKAWKRFSDQAQLQRGVIALNSLGLQVAQTFAPVLNRASGGLTWLQGQAAKHPDATRNLIIGGTAAFATKGIGRLLRGGFGGTAVARAEAIHDLGNTGLGASPASPMYVVVVGNLFNPGGKGIINDIKKYTPPIVLTRAQLARQALRAGARSAMVGGADAALVAGLAASPVIGLAIANHYLGGPTSSMEHPGERPISTQALQNAMRAHPRIRQFFDAARTGRGVMTPQWAQAYKNFLTGGTTPAQFDKMLGRADVYMTIDVNQDGKVVKKRVHIPVDLFKNGAHPGSRGKAAAKNG